MTLNTNLLVMSIAPVLAVMPALMLYFGVLQGGRTSAQWVNNRFWPTVASSRWLSKCLPRLKPRTATRLYFHWKNRLVFSLLVWTIFAISYAITNMP